MIEINKLNFSYGKHQVFSDFSTILKEGAIYGLLGANGVGKTTLLKLICGLIGNFKSKDVQTTVNGWNPLNRDPEFLSNIFYVPEALTLPNVVVESFVKEYGAFYPKFDLNHFYELMKTFDVDCKKKFWALSSGQQKKAFLAYALSLHTDLLLLDEPTNGLDITSKTQFRKIIAEVYHGESTIIISTHQVRDLENLIDPIIILDEKGLLLNASLEEVSEKLEFFADQDLDPNSIYSESGFGGYQQVRLNTSGAYSNVNVETLYNTTLANKELIKGIFNK